MASMFEGWARDLVSRVRNAVLESGPAETAARDERERRLVASSGLFDASFYLIEAPDVQAAKFDPVVHFCAYGWREGRRPNLYFDPTWYSEVYLAARTPPVNPLAHYIRQGENAGCRPVPFFDPAWYRRTYRLPKRQSALAHYLAHRRSQHVAPNPQFDLAFYMARHGDQIGPNRDPFAHLIRCGAGRDYDPSPDFDSAAYRRASMPADADGASTVAAHERRVPLIHYLDALAREAAQRAATKRR